MCGVPPVGWMPVTMRLVDENGAEAAAAKLEKLMRILKEQFSLMKRERL